MRLSTLNLILMVVCAGYGCNGEDDATNVTNRAEMSGDGGSNATAEMGASANDAGSVVVDNDGSEGEDNTASDAGEGVSSYDAGQEGMSPADAEADGDDDVGETGGRDAAEDASQSMSDTPYERALAAAAALDEICRADCDKDLVCNADEAPSADDCFSEYCGFEAVIQDVGAEAVTERLIDCFDAQTELTYCLLGASCENYNAYYDAEGEIEVCLGQNEAFEIACEPFI